MQKDELATGRLCPPVRGERRCLARVTGSAPAFRKEGDMNFRLCLQTQSKIVHWIH